jgi:hypothetical protein
MLLATLALAFSLAASEADGMAGGAGPEALDALPVLTLGGALHGGSFPARATAPRGFAQASTQSGPSHAFGPDPAVRIALACTLGVLFPGLGHAASGTYLYRGLAFSTAFLVSVFGSIAFSAVSVEGLGGPHAETGGILLILGTTVIYVWSLVDALSLAAAPAGGDGW